MFRNAILTAKVASKNSPIVSKKFNFHVKQIELHFFLTSTTFSK